VCLRRLRHQDGSAIEASGPQVRQGCVGLAQGVARCPGDNGHLGHHLQEVNGILAGVKKILIGSGLRYDLAVESPEYVRELVTHQVGGYLKIAPEHTEDGSLSKMMKPGIGSYDRFKQLFDKYSAEAGKKQFLVPYFIAAHPGTTDEDMLNLAVWLKRNGFRADQVQTFYPGPMATATAMYHSGKDPLHKVTRGSPAVDVVRGERRRRLHKAFLRYHDPANWPLLREALMAMGRADLIGNGRHHLVPRYQPAATAQYQSARRKNSTAPGSRLSPVTRGRMLTQHTGLPPRAGAGTGAKASLVGEKRNGNVGKTAAGGSQRGGAEDRRPAGARPDDAGQRPAAGRTRRARG